MKSLLGYALTDAYNVDETAVLYRTALRVEVWHTSIIEIMELRVAKNG